MLNGLGDKTGGKAEHKPNITYFIKHNKVSFLLRLLETNLTHIVMNTHRREDLDTHAGAASARTRSKHTSRVLLESSMLRLSGSGCGPLLLLPQQVNTRFILTRVWLGNRRKCICSVSVWPVCLR